MDGRDRLKTRVGQEVSVRGEFVAAVGTPGDGVEFDVPFAKTEGEDEVVQRRTGVDAEMVLATGAIGPFGDFCHP